jgi:hypothetical protein
MLSTEEERKNGKPNAVLYTPDDTTWKVITTGAMSLAGLGMLLLIFAAYQYRAQAPHDIVMTIGGSLAGLGILLLVIAWLQSYSQMAYASLMSGGAALIGLGVVLLEVGRIKYITHISQFDKEDEEEEEEESPPRSSPK